MTIRTQEYGFSTTKIKTVECTCMMANQYYFISQPVLTSYCFRHCSIFPSHTCQRSAIKKDQKDYIQNSLSTLYLFLPGKSTLTKKVNILRRFRKDIFYRSEVTRNTSRNLLTLSSTDTVMSLAMQYPRRPFYFQL